MRNLLLLILTLLLASCSLQAIPADSFIPGRAVICFTSALSTPEISQTRGIVKIGVPQLDALAEEFGVYSMEKVFKNEKKPSDPLFIDLSRWYYISFPEEVPVADVVEAYKNRPFIEYAEYDLIRHTDYIPNDPLLDECWYIFKIEADSAWDITHGNLLINIAIIDNGIDSGNVELMNNLWINFGEDINGDSIFTIADYNGIDDDENGFIDDFWGWDFIDNDNTPFNPDSIFQHGTAMAGCACAIADNGIGIAGVGFNTRFMPVRCGTGSTISMGVQGINYASYLLADVISLSFGSSIFSNMENMAIQTAWQRGCVIVASAGNDGTSQPHYPAAYENVVGVGATDMDDHALSFSNLGSIDVMAPGEQILTVAFGNNYAYWDGTSLSASITAAACALIKSVAPEIFTNADIVQTLFDNCDDIYSLNPGYSFPQLGYGRINVHQAVLSLVTQQSVVSTAPDNKLSFFGIVNCSPNPFNNSAAISFNLDRTADLTFKIYDVNGREIQSLASGEYVKGKYTVIWNANGSVSGIYFIRMSSSDGQFSVRKIVLMK